MLCCLGLIDNGQHKSANRLQGDCRATIADQICRRNTYLRSSEAQKRSISPHVVFAELAEAPWQRTYWSQVLGFMHRLDSMDEGSLHPDILSDNIHDALGNPRCCNWAAGVQKQFASLGVPSSFSGGRIRNVDYHAFRKAMLARDMSVWEGLHILPRGAPSRGAKLCTYLRWFARPDRISTDALLSATPSSDKAQVQFPFLGRCTFLAD